MSVPQVKSHDKPPYVWWYCPGKHLLDAGQGSKQARIGESALDRITRYRAGHTVAATAPLSEFRSLNRDHLDASFAELGIGVVVAIVGYDHTGLQRDHVVAILPLLALSL